MTDRTPRPKRNPRRRPTSVRPSPTERRPWVQFHGLQIPAGSVVSPDPADWPLGYAVETDAQAEPGREHRAVANRYVAALASIAPTFRRRVQVGGPDDCWLWTGYRSRSGYGMLTVRVLAKPGGPATFYAHRLVYEAAIGRLGRDDKVTHRCGVRHCLNPAHLVAVVGNGGLYPFSKHGRRTHCGNGHALTPDNLYKPAPKHPRRCVACTRLWLRESYTRRSSYAGTAA